MVHKEREQQRQRKLDWCIRVLWRRIEAFIHWKWANHQFHETDFDRFGRFLWAAYKLRIFHFGCSWNPEIFRLLQRNESIWQNVIAIGMSGSIFFFTSHSHWKGWKKFAMFYIPMQVNRRNKFLFYFFFHKNRIFGH